MDRQDAHRLLDELDPGQLAAIGHVLQVMVGSAARTVAAAPDDDEPVTEEDRRRFHEGQAYFAKRGGRGVPMEDVLAEMGLTVDDLR